MYGGVTGSRILVAVVGTSPLWLAILLFIYGPENGPVINVHSTLARRNPLKNMANLNKASFWNSADMKKLDIPESVIESSKKITITEQKIQIDEAEVYYREADVGNSEVHILLLHGMRFSSKTWLDLNTIQLLAAMGHRVIAADLPGYANSPSASVHDRGQFLKQLIEGLNMKHPVIVSPSMSGSYALPYLLKNWINMGGYIPVAPIGWEVLENHKECGSGSSNIENVPEPLKMFLKSPVPDLGCIQVPTLVVYGENDRSRSSALLCLLPFSQAAEIPKGAHPAYLTDPDLWHKLLYNFLDYVSIFVKNKSSK